MTDDLIKQILEELTVARNKFPGKNVTFAALIEEVGELATALFEEPASRVKEEAIQVIVMAMRVILDGDHTFDSWRQSKNLDPLVVEIKESDTTETVINVVEEAKVVDEQL